MPANSESLRQMLLEAAFWEQVEDELQLPFGYQEIQTMDVSGTSVYIHLHSGRSFQLRVEELPTEPHSSKPPLQK